MREVPALTGRNAERQQRRPKCGHSETSVTAQEKDVTSPQLPAALLAFLLDSHHHGMSQQISWDHVRWQGP